MCENIEFCEIVRAVNYADMFNNFAIFNALLEYFSYRFFGVSNFMN